MRDKGMQLIKTCRFKETLNWKSNFAPHTAYPYTLWFGDVDKLFINVNSS